jgi:hypothetical protein
MFVVLVETIGMSGVPPTIYGLFAGDGSASQWITENSYIFGDYEFPEVIKVTPINFRSDASPGD